MGFDLTHGFRHLGIVDMLSASCWSGLARDNSILAQGFVTVDRLAWEQAKSWVETHMVHFFRHAEFPQLPSMIPQLHDGAS